jgi:hypothetical protein
MKKLLWIITALLAFAPQCARAEIFVWQDPVYNMQVTFPDNWMRQAQLDDDLRLYILAPQGADHAACHLYVNHDGRFMDAPAYAGQQVSAYVFDGNEITSEFYNRPDTNNVSLASYSNGASLGSSAAVMAQANFQKSWNGGTVPMHAFVVASQYNGNHIFMTCEALAQAFPRWEALFRGIFKSVSFPPAFAIEPNGLYRRFQDDGGVILPLNRRNDAVTIR